MTTDGPAALRMLAGDFELTKAACWNEGDTASMWTLAAAWDAERAQAAADRAALAQARALLEKHAVRFGALGMKCAECGMVLPGHDEACKIAALSGGAR